MALIPVFKNCSREYLIKNWEIEFPVSDWVSIEFLHEQVKGLDPDISVANMTYTDWLEQKGYVTDEELRKRLDQDGFSKAHADKRIQEMHEIYEDYCVKHNFIPVYNSSLDEDVKEYETNRYNIQYRDVASSKTLSVYLYMNEESDRIIAIDEVVCDAESGETYPLEETPFFSVLRDVRTR
ncbi:hypothetical protein bcgnr5390_11350 [Bacillus luti]|nr:hypothetical protein BC2903_29560 [Bacillus cereus]